MWSNALDSTQLTHGLHWPMAMKVENGAVDADKQKIWVICAIWAWCDFVDLPFSTGMLQVSW